MKPCSAPLRTPTPCSTPGGTDRTRGLGWMSPAVYAAARRSAALRSPDGSASRTVAITAQRGITERQTPIAAG